MRLPLLAKLRLLKNTLATVSKLVFAFFYQEQTFDIDVVTSPLGNQVNRRQEVRWLNGQVVRWLNGQVAR